MVYNIELGTEQNLDIFGIFETLNCFCKITPSHGKPLGKSSLCKIVQ